jgi:regulator of cell morphogenesis and NO signaling
MTSPTPRMSDLTVNQIVGLYPETAAVFNAFKIDACCGGAVSIREAALRDEADADAVILALETLLAVAP